MLLLTVVVVVDSVGVGVVTTGVVVVPKQNIFRKCNTQKEDVILPQPEILSGEVQMRPLKAAPGGQL